MKVKMLRMELLTSEYGKKFTKSWDNFCIATDAYLNGYKQAREDCQNYMDEYRLENDDNAPWYVDDTGDEQVEVEITDGLHQLSAHSFDKWKKEIEQKPFKEALIEQLKHFEFSDLRVVEEDGIISFMGVAKRK